MRKAINLIGSAEAAEILGKSRSQTNRLASIGKLPFVRKGDGPRGEYTFDRSEVERLARERDAA